MHQKLRNALLEVIYRLPHEPMRPYVVDVADDVMRALEAENEDNAVVCLRIIIELHKTNRSSSSSAAAASAAAMAAAAAASGPGAPPNAAATAAAAAAAAAASASPLENQVQSRSVPAP